MQYHHIYAVIYILYTSHIQKHTFLIEISLYELPKSILLHIWIIKYAIS